MCVSIAGCSGSASVSYQPPDLPINISINTDGQLEVSWANSIQTPIGTFSTDVSTDLSGMYQDKKGVLIVNVNGVNSVYDLNGQNNITITLESGYYKQIELRKEGLNWYFEAARISGDSPTPQATLIPSATLTAIRTLQANLTDFIKISNLKNYSDNQAVWYVTFSLTNVSKKPIFTWTGDHTACNDIDNAMFDPGTSDNNVFCESELVHGISTNSFWFIVKTQSEPYYCWQFELIHGSVKSCP